MGADFASQRGGYNRTGEATPDPLDPSPVRLKTRNFH